jgi:hypothetical protein
MKCRVANVYFGWKADVDLRSASGKFNRLEDKYMERIATFALWTAMAVLVVVMAFGLFLIVRGVTIQSISIIGYGVRVIVLSLGAFAIFAMLSSIRGRLGAIQTRLNER